MKRAEILNEYLYDTKVENIFINEYMVSAPGDFVKVYLLALMFVDLDQPIDDQMIGKTLSIPVDEVERAWEYWARAGVIKRGSGETTFVSFKEKMYGTIQVPKSSITGSSVEVESGSSHILDNKELKSMVKSIEKSIGRPLSPVEVSEIHGWMDDYDAAPEVIAYGFAYCFARKKENIKYIAKVVQGWTSRGFSNILQVEKFLKENDQRHYMYKRVMQALGFPRNATEEEKRMIDKWFDQMNFSIEVVLDACKKTTGISSPNLNYINRILENWSAGPGGTGSKPTKATVSQISDYYEKLRRDNEDKAKANRAQVMSKYPKVQALNEEIKEMQVELSRVMVSGGADKIQRLNKLREQIESYKEIIKKVLTENGVPTDYMEVHYNCPICKDTGKLETGAKCQCYQQVVDKINDQLSAKNSKDDSQPITN
ncbi:MAG: DnaD domain protein [Anaerovoracaceae bacterium]